jgi:hypothetical protein
VSTHREHQYHVEPQPLEVLHNLASSSANDDSDDNSNNSNDNSNNSNDNTIGSSLTAVSSNDPACHPRAMHPSPALLNV